MWEGDPVGVDPKRPLVGFAVVAVLCAVLMFLSMGRGWSVDFLQPGKPIAPSPMGGHLERVPAPAPDPAEPVELVEVGFPVGLSTQPLATSPRTPKAVAKKAKSERAPVAPDTTSDDAVGADETSDPTTDRVEPRADRRAERAAARAERKLAKLEARAQRKADRSADRQAGPTARPPAGTLGCSGVPRRLSAMARRQRRRRPRRPPASRPDPPPRPERCVTRLRGRWNPPHAPPPRASYETRRARGG